MKNFTTTHLNFVSHGTKPIQRKRIRPILGHRRVGETINRIALARMITSATGIHGTALGVDMRTKAFCGLITTGDVRHATIVGNETILAHKLVDGRVRAAMAAPGHAATAIENVLDGQIDFIARGIPSYFDAICQGTEGPMRPAAAAVLREVLIE